MKNSPVSLVLEANADILKERREPENDRFRHNKPVTRRWFFGDNFYGQVTSV